LIEINHRGIGKSYCGDGEFFIKDLADDVLNVLNHLSIETYSLIGISMGGFIAQEIISRNPDGLKSVSLLCTTFGGEDYFNFPFIKDEDIVKLFSIEKNKRAELSVATTTHPSLFEYSPNIYSEILNYRKNLEVSMDTIIKQNHAAIDFMKNGVVLDKVPVPVFIGHGEKDRFVPFNNAKMMAKEIKTATFKFYPDSDHFFFWEKGSELSKDLNGFFMEHSK
jgi:pimeloyl-ACP methyl ester carboxylesterase